MAASITKFTAGWIHFPALGTGKFQFVATFIAKPGVFRILMLAF
jgi:hypothetical protein